MWYLLQTKYSCKCEWKLTITVCNRPLSVALMFSFNSSGVPGLLVRNLAVSCPQRKWQGTERLGEMADRAISPKRKNNTSGKTGLSHNPSNHALFVLWHPVAEKKCHHRRHQRPPLTSPALPNIVLRLQPLYLLERSGPNNSQSRHSTKNRGFRNACRLFENSAWLLIVPVSEILFIGLPGEVKLASSHITSR